MTRVVLHIGAFKTGTSFIQDSLFLNKKALADRGVLVPGATWSTHSRAVRDLLRQVNATDTGASGQWQQLVDSCRRWTGDVVVVSMEFLSTARRDVVERAVRDLQPLDVRVVLGARDLTPTLPAQWQESVQSSGRTWTLDAYVSSAMLPRRAFDDASQHFWRKHHWPTILRRWARYVQTSELVLMTVPPSGSPAVELWHRFGLAAGFDATSLPPAPRANESLGAHSLEVARRVNLCAQANGDTTSGRAVFKNVLCKQILAGRRNSEPRAVFPDDRREWAVTRTEGLLRQLARLDVRLVGSLDDLRPSLDGVPGTSTPEASEPTALLAACHHALTELGAPAPSARPGLSDQDQLDAAIDALTTAVLTGGLRPAQTTPRGLLS